MSVTALAGGAIIAPIGLHRPDGRCTNKLAHVSGLVNHGADVRPRNLRWQQRYSKLQRGMGKRNWRGPECKLKAGSIGEIEFETEVLHSTTPVLVDFWATWCGPCKLVAPLMDWVAQEYAGTIKVLKIETDSNPKLVEKYKVYGLPTIILFQDGKEVPGSRKEGAIGKTKLQILIHEHLPHLAPTSSSI